MCLSSSDCVTFDSPQNTHSHRGSSALTIVRYRSLSKIWKTWTSIQTDAECLYVCIVHRSRWIDTKLGRLFISTNWMTFVSYSSSASSFLYSKNTTTFLHNSFVKDSYNNDNNQNNKSNIYVNMLFSRVSVFCTLAWIFLHVYKSSIIINSLPQVFFCFFSF